MIPVNFTKKGNSFETLNPPAPPTSEIEAHVANQMSADVDAQLAYTDETRAELDPKIRDMQDRINALRDSLAAALVERDKLANILRDLAIRDQEFDRAEEETK